jgi:phage terminase large subunit-like protein
MDLTKPYNKYAKDVVDGKIIACEAIRLACKRYLEWFNRTDIYFDEAEVEKKIRFISLMKHSTGKHNGKRFILLPWQAWCVAHIFGFKYTDTNLRVINNVFIMISRKAGKTAFAAALGLCCAIADNEANAEIELVANSRQQANIAFQMCYNFAESLDPKKKSIRRKRAVIEIPKTKSSIQVLSSDAMGNDGYNSSCFILDEMHAAKNWDLYNVMKSSQGMRQQPLAIVITTAGFLLNGYPCYEYRATCIEILKGIKDDDSTFAAIYELDENDNWQDENNWIKCAPSLGQTVTYKYLKDQVKSAINTPAQEVGVKTKNFNIFCQSKEIWIPDRYIIDCTQRVNIEDFKDEDSYLGVDLSAVSDLTATSILFPPNPERKVFPDKFVFKSFIYLPETCLEESQNSELYKTWTREKHLQLTSGNVVDYDFILADQKKLYEQTYMINVAYDSWNATQWAINATEEGLPLVPYSQAVGNFNRPTKYLEMLIRQNKVIIDYNPIVRWAFGNVSLKFDANDNCKPTKANNDRARKIDPVIAMIQALGGFLDKNKYNDGEVLSVTF